MPFNFLQTNGHCKTFNIDCIDSDMDALNSAITKGHGCIYEVVHILLNLYDYIVQV